MPETEVVKPRTEEEDQRETAAVNLAHIATLRRTEAFTEYFLEEPDRRIVDLDRELRARDLPELERQFVLGQIDIYERWRNKLAEDERSFRNIL